MPFYSTLFTSLAAGGGTAVRLVWLMQFYSTVFTSLAVMRHPDGYSLRSCRRQRVSAQIAYQPACLYTILPPPGKIARGFNSAKPLDRCSTPN